jgi:ubiquinone/menaquinone biosynthesis C-methylase UbiE
MIHYANENKKQIGNPSNVSFGVGDIRKMQFDDNTFDVVYTTRVLINLPNWDEQIQGIEECIRITKKGGTVILSEGFWEPLVLLNSLRALKQLPPLVEHDFNRYIKKSKLETLLQNKSLILLLKNLALSII